MTVTGIEQQKNRRGRYSIFADGEFVIGVRTEILARSGLRRGDQISPEDIARLKEAEARAEARSIAVRFAGRRRRTEEEVRRKLTGKDIPQEITEEVIRSLKESNVINDDEYVRAFIHDAGLGKPAGSRLISLRLRRKGISGQVLERILPECLSPETEAMMARALAESYLARGLRGGKDHSHARKRSQLRQYLAQRGFTGTAVERALRQIAMDSSTEE